jgi:hypothetical protein
MCNSNQIIKLASTIKIPAFLINSFSCCHTLLKITTKSGFLQVTISTKKNDLARRNKICENINPMNRATKPEAIVRVIVVTHPHAPNKKLET